MRRLLLLFSFLIFLNFTGLGQVRKYSNEFLSIGVGAHALSMSNARVASVNDVTAGYWNPAGLNGIKDEFQLGLMHSNYFQNIAKYDYGSLAKRIDSTSVIAATVVRFAVDDIPNTTDLIDANGNIDYDRITSFSAADYGFLISYAKQLKPAGLTAGGNVKIIHRVIGDFAKSWGFGLDAGLQYEKKNWLFGVMLRDATTTYNAWSFSLTDQMKQVFSVTGNTIPENSVELTAPKLILGTARKFTYKKLTALMEVDADITFDRMRNVLIKSDPISIDPHAGLQLGYEDFIFIRGGLGNIQTVTVTHGFQKKIVQTSFGAGVKIKGITIDYALANVTQSVGLLSHVFSLKFNINKRS
jgi:hypothetical protein